MNVLVVIPVYNHAATIRAVAQAVLRSGRPLLVVDDGSDDGSLDRVADLDILRLRCARNRGKGHAILRAAAVADRMGYDAILTLDADGQHDPADGGLLLAAAAGTWPAIVVGARRMEAGHAPRSSRFGRAFSNFWVRLECGLTLPDTQSGYRLYPVPFLLSRRFFTRRYSFEVEVLVRGGWAGLPLLSVPVPVYYPPGPERVSHFRKFRDNLRLTGLHTHLVLRSLLPWPHRRLLARPERPGFLSRLRGEHTSAGELAAAAGVGIFVGSLPIIPFGLAAILYVSHKLHLNKLAAAGASNLCIVPFVPFLCVQAGHLLLHGRLLTRFNRVTLLHQIHLRVWEWLLGSLIVGPLLGAAGALLTYGLVRAFRAKAGGQHP
jgi:glycosyltransferase involved in cell wall biosynthesis